MTDNVLQERATKYREYIVEFIVNEFSHLAYSNGYPCEVKELAEAIAEKIAERFGLSKNTQFEKDLALGLEQLNEKLLKIASDNWNGMTNNSKLHSGKTLTADSFVEQSGLNDMLKDDKLVTPKQQKMQDRIERHEDYIKNPSIIKAVTNAMHDFADYVCDIFCKYFGKDKNEATNLLCRAFESLNKEIERETKAKPTVQDELWEGYKRVRNMIHNSKDNVSDLIKEQGKIENELGMLNILLYSMSEILTKSQKDRQI
ncbi:MAG: hypothetical protein K2P53_05500 [Rickettsiales bacterium]|jgi:SMC interacting uncharacterized protein involved in chromosome segregation|nr:hypothetical protein [Rickettsiales bacterium]